MLKINFMYSGKNLLPPNSVMFKSYLMNRNDVLPHPFSRKVIREIDRSTVINPREIDSPVLGIISMSDLSGGTKGLLLMKFAFELRPYYFRGGGFGDNCAEFILEIAEDADIKMALGHLMDLPFREGTEVFIENSGQIVRNFKEYADAYSEFYRAQL